jgi:hypothetical protein
MSAVNNACYIVSLVLPLLPLLYPSIFYPKGNSVPKAKSPTEARSLVVVGAGEDEANGVYLEAVETYYKTPQFVKRIEATDVVSAGWAVMWYAESGRQWSIRKEPDSRYGTSKLWYVALAVETEGRSGSLDPPTNDWEVSAQSGKRKMGDNYYSIHPAPTIEIADQHLREKRIEIVKKQNKEQINELKEPSKELINKLKEQNKEQLKQILDAKNPELKEQNKELMKRILDAEQFLEQNNELKGPNTEELKQFLNAVRSDQSFEQILELVNEVKEQKKEQVNTDCDCDCDCDCCYEPRTGAVSYFYSILPFYILLLFWVGSLVRKDYDY